MGQHFLKNPSILKKIIQVIAPQKNDLIIEIGAGKGALTFPLAQKAGQVIAIEKDPRLIPALQKKRSSNLLLLNEDVLKVDFQELIRKNSMPGSTAKLVGNLPYSISSPLLLKVQENKTLFSLYVFLLQKEFAERLCAKPCSKNYAPLSILLQVDFTIRLHFTIASGSFSPPPRVESALISMKKRSKPLFSIKEEWAFREFLKEAFQQRRKTLYNNLKRMKYPSAFLDEVFEKLNLKRVIRPEELSISQFVILFEYLFKIPEKGRP